MKFFIDTADLNGRAGEELGRSRWRHHQPRRSTQRRAASSRISRTTWSRCQALRGLPVSAESQAKTTEGMIADGERLAALAPNIVVKLPICEESLPATHTLAKEGIRVNMTLVFSTPQALPHPSAGARYINPFVGRFDDIGDDGIQQLATVVQCVKNYTYGYWDGEVGPEINHRLCAHAQPRDAGGSSVLTLPPCPSRRSRSAYATLPTKVMKRFDADWAKVTETSLATTVSRRRHIGITKTTHEGRGSSPTRCATTSSHGVEVKSGHPGGSLSCTDILATLFFTGVMSYDENDPSSPERDLLYPSPRAMRHRVLYAAFHQLGWVRDDELGTLRRLGTRLQGHPDRNALPGVEVCSGSWGRAFSIAAGAALGFLARRPGGTSVRARLCVCGDGLGGLQLGGADVLLPTTGSLTSPCSLTSTACRSMAMCARSTPG